MAMQDYYKKVMEINQMADLDARDKAAKAFFDDLNKSQLPEYFNWAEEIFEGLHVKERGEQDALIWVNLETGEDKKFTYLELAANGNKVLNLLRKKRC